MADLLSVLRQAVQQSPGLRIGATLSTLNGGHHLLPPTYADAPYGHNMTQPDEHGVAAWVSIDSAASFANRVEEQLLRCGLDLAPVAVQLPDGTRLSTLQMPHRIFDAILRDSQLNGTRFEDTEIGRAVFGASPVDATGLLRHDPAVLLLGGWDSTRLGRRGGRERKWAAALSVEITGAGARPVARAGGRLDPLGIPSDAATILHEAGETDYQLLPEGEQAPSGAATKRPSEINHGNIAPTLKPKGVLVDSIALNGVLSLSRLRRYRFGDDEDANVAARTLLACMGVYGVAAVLEDGLDLRRDCELVATEVHWSIPVTGSPETTPLTITRATALEALRAAREAVALAAPVTFAPGPNLEQLIARSR
ncbi:type I-G CRISPR-associated RAMP protein Csb1/Cas7g [Marichromatium bheemlicum]|uniref:type I-G CRISPR-associated RAMP protein Csb1/Cas7g n=1 Tax=Marichromatium bheemlicum TaxID=365339 RepID=UPI002483BE1A|nr:type I-U CRISPR-associated RAMP protein Csb1/Cas7u [Marichromatium bheemlicum]